MGDVRRDARPLTATETLLEERGSVYGDIRYNVRCQEELMKVFRRFSGHSLAFQDQTQRESDHTLVMGLVMHKIARIATGAIHADNYADAAGYLELARRVAMDKGQAE